MILKILIKNKLVILYGISMAVLLMLVRWMQLRFLIYDHAVELYAGGIAIMFTALGIWLASKLTRPKVKTVIIEREVRAPETAFVVNEKELASLGMSRRELEVLELMAEGLSNQQIAERLFVSLNTIKTHSSKIFEKMEVQRRTQAVEKAKRLRLIP